MMANSLSNELLRYEREKRNWTQQDVAEKIGAPDPKMVGRWERGVTTPQTQYIRKLSELFEKSARELGITRADEVPFWNIPSRQNPFFTSREDILARLYESRFACASETTPRFQAQAICGLGGVGKTQTAIEYAYRYRSHYSAILWVKADTSETLASDFAHLATVLNLPEKNDQDQTRVIEAVKVWLATFTRWLLILDNADDLQLVSNYIPSPCPGHLLLTTRTSITGNLAQPVFIDCMDIEEGAYFLLRRAGIIQPQFERGTISDTLYNEARAISHLLGGLPLALDQAGAYIEETQCGLENYTHRYQTQHEKILQRRGEFVVDHADPVPTTWALSFDKIRQNNPLAIELLSLCAFLAPEAIPEEILTAGAPNLEPGRPPVPVDQFELDEVIKELLKFSLVRRDPAEKTLTLHRLVQTVLRDRMDAEMQRRYAEHAVRAVQHVFPDVGATTWLLCQRYLSHAQACAGLISQWHMQFSEAIQLLNRCGTYLYQRAQYPEAEVLFQLAVAMREQATGPELLDEAVSLSNLSRLYWDQVKFTQAEPLLLRALSIRKRILGANHPQVASSLNDLALLYKAQDKYDQAESIFLQALAVRENELAPDSLAIATTLNNLAMLYCNSDRFLEAEPLFLRALSICERILGPEHPDVAGSLNHLAGLYLALSRHAEAEPLFLRALSMREKLLGPEHPEVATILNNLALLFSDLAQFTASEPLFLRAQAIHQKIHGPEHPSVATILNNLALLYCSQQMFDKAEPLFQQALAISKRTLGPDHPLMAIVWQNYASLLQTTAHYNQAAELEARAAALWHKRHQKASGPLILAKNASPFYAFPYLQKIMTTMALALVKRR